MKKLYICTKSTNIMKTTSTTTTFGARTAMTLLLLLTITQGTWATNYITEVMLIGGNKEEVNTLKSTYTERGWTVFNQDLNAGAGGDYIYLLYKTAADNNTHNLTFITDFYLSTTKGTVDKDITYNGRTYHLVPYDGGSHFESIQGNLNSNAGGSDIHLYYTTTFKLDDQLSPDNMAVDTITFNDNKTGAVGKNGGDTGYDLNAGCGSSTDDIYMHLYSSRANYWTFQKNSDGTRCRIRGYEGKTSSVIAIPAIIEGAAVEDIYPNVVFTEFEALQKIYFHSSLVITTMPSVANLSKLTNVHLVDNNGNVIENELPPSITTIPDGAFKNTPIKGLKMPNVSSIGASAFNGCTSMISVTLGKKIESIGIDAFLNCNALESIDVASGSPTYDSRDNCNAIIETSSNTLIVGCKNTIIPNSVTSIGNSAFYNRTSLTSVIIGKSVTSIGESAFNGCSSLNSVIIGKSVTSIGNSAFSNCSSLTSVNIPNSVTSIGNNAFIYCSSLNSVNIGDSVTSIGNSAFSNCSSLTSVKIPNSVTSIGENAFNGCDSLTSVNIPNSVKSIGESTFKGCSSLNSVNIPNSVTSIGNFAFSDCFSLKSVIIGDSVTSLGNFAFSSCSSLNSVIIGKSVTSIGNFAFGGCSVVTDVYCYAGPSVLTWEKSSSDEFKKNKATKCHVFNAEDWGDFVSTINVTFVGDLAIDLSDKADNDSLIILWSNRKVNARLQGRTLQKDGNWHTLCLPFALTSLDGTPLKDATVVELDVAGTYNNHKTGYDASTGTLRLYFKSATSITAGKPYLIKWANGNEIVNPVFQDLYLSTDAPTTVTSSDNKVTFVGNYTPMSFTGEDKTTLFLDDGNTLHHPVSATTINAFRGRFLLPEGLTTTDLGDVNGDKAITISDVMAVVNYIMGNTNSNFLISQADLNGDKQVTVADVMELVNRVIHGNKSFKVVTNLDDLTITYGGSGIGPARGMRNN